MRQTALGVVAFPEPAPCSVFARQIEMLHLGMDKMACDIRYDIRDSTVCNDRHFFNPVQVLLEKLQMGQQRAEVLPARKRRCMYQYTV